MGLGNRFAGDPTLETKSLDYHRCHCQDKPERYNLGQSRGIQDSKQVGLYVNTWVVQEGNLLLMQ